MVRSWTFWCWPFCLLTACAVNDGSDSALPDLSGRVFLSESVAGRMLVPGSEIRLGFHATDLSANAGCNSLFGPYRFEDDVLVVASLGSTLIGCDLALAEQDQWLAGFLKARPRAELVEPRLTLATATETVSLIDREIASPDRPLVATRWIGNGASDGSVVNLGLHSELATVVFGADGRVEAFSGCQHASGTFTAHEATIEFAELAYDGAACPAQDLGWLDDRFRFVLDGSRVDFEIEERELRLDRAGSSLYFRAE